MTAVIDWDAATIEAVGFLREYLRIDTSNPPGNEAEAVDFLGAILDREGIPFETAESAPGRSNLLAGLGPQSGGICLLNHTDVVPAEEQYWEIPPFDGELRDGAVWGRGALDMKGMGVIELMVFLLLKRRGIPLKRGVRFLAAADEEAGSTFGVAWLAEHRPSWLESELVINEGSYGLAPVRNNQSPVFQVAPSEKLPLWVKLSVTGRPGHGSVPHGDNCAEHLVAALERIRLWNQPLRVTPLMRAHLAGMANAKFMSSADEKTALQLAEQRPSLKARLGNTISLTTINTGIKVNVIPAIATATLDCRLLPDVKPAQFLDELRQVIRDNRVEIEVLNQFEGAESPLDHEFIRVVSDVVGELVEGAKVVPDMTSGFTDSRVYRARGIPAYGFVPCILRGEELTGVHGHNERVSVENLKLGMQVLYEVVLRLVAA